ncbi:myo-inositol-1(or 4)-monophosphatase [Oceanospirillum multiglobuliferum]|nr:myo-inositol-1(or 4)-monophosphatase [Oceanospirillum multiglobuliferum]
MFHLYGIRMHPMVQLALRTARSAVQNFQRINERLDIARKENTVQQLLEETARSVEEYVIKQLTRAHPEHSFKSQYQRQIPGKGEGKDIVWTVQAAHGWDNLSRSLPMAALSISCEIKGKIEHVIVLNPFTGDEYTASRGRSAQLNGRRVRVSNQRAIEAGKYALPLPSLETRGRNFALFMGLTQQIGQVAESLHNSGCNLLDLLSTTAGFTDASVVYGVDENEMRIAALFAKESGALIGAIDGSPNLPQDGNLILANPKMYKIVLQIAKNYQ